MAKRKLLDQLETFALLQRQGTGPLAHSAPDWSEQLSRAIDLLDQVNGKLDRLLDAIEPAKGSKQ